MDALGALAQIIPEHIHILQVRLRVTLLSVDKVRELGRVAQEENRGVVKDPVPVALLRADLDRKPARVARGIGRTRLATDGGEAHSDGRTVADLVEDGGAADVGDIVGDLEVTVCAGTLGVNDTLGNALAVKVSEEVDVVEV